MKESLDRTDFEILDALQNNARISNKELAAIVGLAPSSCLQRVRSLSEAGTLRGFHADINPGALGIGIQALIAINLKRHARDLYNSLHGYLLSLEEVVSVFHLTGGTDLLVHIVARDTEHLRNFIVDKVAARKEVLRCETSIVYGAERKFTMPNYTEHND